MSSQQIDPVSSAQPGRGAENHVLTLRPDNVESAGNAANCAFSFSKIINTAPTPPSNATPSSESERPFPLSPQYRKASLLTQALTSPELGPLSDADAPLLTSDGGMTSPARTVTPSPPLPAMENANLRSITPTNLADSKQPQKEIEILQDACLEQTQEVKVTEELGRRRCITFACLQAKSKTSQDRPYEKPSDTKTADDPSEPAPPKRPCMLRFACPAKPYRARSQEPMEPLRPARSSSDGLEVSASRPAPSVPSPHPSNTESQHTQGDERAAQSATATQTPAVKPDETSLPGKDLQTRPNQFNRVDFQKSEATRFHEFAGCLADEGEWVNEQTAYRQKITINDTLRKENAIRQLAEQADEEEQDDSDDAFENLEDSADEASDDGNETDDEDGFAESEDDSEAESSYRFWTTSRKASSILTENTEQCCAPLSTNGSMSILDAPLSASPGRKGSSLTDAKKIKQSRGNAKGAPSSEKVLPDSSDFVVGTIDEDQTYEDQYASRRKLKEQLKQRVIPQDIDPSFPNSDVEDDNDDESEGNESDDEGAPSDQLPSQKHDSSKLHRSWKPLKRHPDDEESISNEIGKSPNPSPRRLHSPPPPVRRLFGQSTHRVRSPPPMQRKLVSPRSSRRQSPNGSFGTMEKFNETYLAQRPNLVFTSSLPRTPNPFWQLHSRSDNQDDTSPSSNTVSQPMALSPSQGHRRGPIEIVQGLENKRQRRKERFWRLQSSRAHAGKDKDRRCLPGTGARRMREVGLVMADRFKGYKQDAPVVLSI